MSDLLHQGGIVVVIILGLSVLAWVLIGCEWLRLRQQSGGDWTWVEAALDHIREGKPPPRDLLAPYRWNVIGRLLGADLGRKRRRRRSFHTQVAPHLKSEAITLERPLRLIGVMAAVLPLLGLLGTVLGMVQTFDALMAGQGARVDALAGGISQALVTTQVGLVAAVPVLLAHGYLRARARRYIETSALMLKRIESVVCVEREGAGDV